MAFASPLSTAASLVIAGLCLTLVWAGSVRRRAKGAPLLEDDRGRIASLDGLRGFLALGVVLSHGVSYRDYYATHRWEPCPEFLFRFLGIFAVQVFFAITAFLFGSQALRSRGEFALGEFYLRRFRRLYPLYGAVAGMAFLLCLVVPGRLQADPTDTFVVAPLVLAFPGYAPWRAINGIPAGLLLTQTWTLRIEVFFYLALPFVAAALLAKGRRAWISRGIVALVVGLLILRLLPADLVDVDAPTLVPFAIGALAAVLDRLPALKPLARSGWGAALAIGSVVMLLALQERTRAVFNFFFLATFFVPVALGNSLFGFLNRPTCRRLGELSYSIYMVHMVVFFVVLAFFNRFFPIAQTSEGLYWLMVSGVAVITLGLSALTSQTLEKPFIGPVKRAEPELTA